MKALSGKAHAFDQWATWGWKYDIKNMYDKQNLNAYSFYTLESILRAFQSMNCDVIFGVKQ